MKYQALYEELNKLDDELSDDIGWLEENIERRKTQQLIFEQELAGKLLLRCEIRQFLKESGVIDDETSDWT